MLKSYFIFIIALALLLVFTIDHVFVNAVTYKCIECQEKPPSEFNPSCDDDKVCILTEQTCSKCPERICQPKTNPKCNTCPTPKCDNTNSTEYCVVQENFCYNCGKAYYSSQYITGITCIQMIPWCVDPCPLNYECHIWRQDNLTCSQATCVPLVRWSSKVRRIDLGKGFEKLNKQHQMNQKRFQYFEGDVLKKLEARPINISSWRISRKSWLFESAKSEVENVENPIDFNVKGFNLPSLDYCGQLESFIEKLYKKTGDKN
ncbi:hypothetical protein F8M41_015351 [Gigaspora margarita]|uniref:Membrane anchor Opy2 N-terminal domain-containing protein n=1 Tax=Gigaspora margarita TaxID=4874 RepID=A0A8H4B3H2_GIGMA|nr:hypothetical protein F8M41_015351 [Gigaspora margarita]